MLKVVWRTVFIEIVKGKSNCIYFSKIRVITEEGAIIPVFFHQFDLYFENQQFVIFGILADELLIQDILSKLKCNAFT